MSAQVPHRHIVLGVTIAAIAGYAVFSIWAWRSGSEAMKAEVIGTWKDIRGGGLRLLAGKQLGREARPANGIRPQACGRKSERWNMRRLIVMAALAVCLSGCGTIERLALAAAPTASIAVNERVAEHCVQQAQAGQPVDQRRQVRADFAGIAYDTEVRPRTTTAQQEGVDRGRQLRRELCPPIPRAEAAAPPPAEPSAQ